MKSNRRCPDCNQWLEQNTDECYCGWISNTSNKSTKIDYQCAYQASGKRCPLGGSNSFSRHGSKCDWYCLKHYQHINDPKKSYEILIDAIHNFESIMEDLIDWRVKLIPEVYQAKKHELSNLVHQLKMKGEIK